MVGIETLAIEVSSTCMKVPNARASAVRLLRLPPSAAGGASMAAFALTDSCSRARGQQRRLRGSVRGAMAGRCARAGCVTRAAELRGLVGLRSRIVGDDGRNARIDCRI